MSLNKVQLIGRTGKDPEIRTVNDTTVASVSLATSEKKKGGSEVTEWHNLVFWGRSAEAVQKYVQKGTQLYIEGKIHTRSYESGGVKKYITEIRVDSFEMLAGYRKPHTGGRDFRDDPPVETVHANSAQDDLPF
jgi:single-strand DNA-binding protein